jgi:hypothetical protein
MGRTGTLPLRSSTSAATTCPASTWTGWTSWRCVRPPDSPPSTVRRTDRSYSRYPPIATTDTPCQTPAPATGHYVLITVHKLFCFLFVSVLGIHDILVRIRTSLVDPDPTPDQTPFFSGCKDAKKNFIFFSLITYPQAHYLQS